MDATASRVTYPLAGLIRTHLLLRGQAGRDQHDADRRRQDPSLRAGFGLRAVARHRSSWGLRQFRERLLRTAARVVKQASRLIFLVAGSVAEDRQCLWRWQKVNR